MSDSKVITISTPVLQSMIGTEHTPEFNQEAKKFVDELNARWDKVRANLGMKDFELVEDDMDFSRFKDICKAGFHDAAFPYLDAYIYIHNRTKSNPLDGFCNDPKGRAMVILKTKMCNASNILAFRDDLKLTKTLCKIHYHTLLTMSKEKYVTGDTHNQIPFYFIHNNDNIDVIKFMLKEYPELMKNPPYEKDGYPMQIIRAKTPEILKDLIEFYGIDIIANFSDIRPTYIDQPPIRRGLHNMYKGQPETMAVIKKMVRTDADFDKFCKIHFGESDNH